MTDKEFQQLVADGIDALPERIQASMQNVAIVIADEPSTEDLEEMQHDGSSTLFGLYQGIPLVERGVEYDALPDKITIFKNPILRAYSDKNEIRKCVENTIWHEVAHHFGYDDEWIEREEERRGKTL